MYYFNSGAVLSSATISTLFLYKLTIFGILLSLTLEISTVWIFLLEIVQFRVRYDRWIKEVKTHFLQA